MALTLIPLLLVSYVVYYIYSTLQDRRKEREFDRFRAENGCSLAYQVKNKYPWGLERVWGLIMLPWKGLDLFDDIFIPLQAKAGYTSEGVGILGMKQYSTSEPKNLQAVLATKFNDFEQGERRHKMFGIFIGKNIFNSDGAYWEHSRALFRPQFNREKINDLEETEHSTKVMFQTMPIGSDGWTEEVDISRLFFMFTLDTAVAFMFGRNLDSLKGAIPGNQSQGLTEAELAGRKASGLDMDLKAVIEVAQEYLSLRLKLQGLYWLADSPRLRKSIKYFQAFTSYFVEEAIEAHGNDMEKGIGSGKKYNLLKALAQETQDPIELRDQSLAILFAGRDTTAALLSWMFYELGRRPDVFNKLRTLVLDEFGTDPERIDFARLKSCKYLQYVMNETLRLWPSVPANNRIAVRDTVLPVGGGPNKDQPVAVRKGQNIFFSVYVMHHRKDLWGEDASEFRPERWEGRKMDWSFLPFLGGPRLCLGQQYALTEAGYLTVRLLQRFDRIEYTGPPGKPRKGLGITLFPRDGTKVRMRLAKS